MRAVLSAAIGAAHVHASVDMAPVFLDEGKRAAQDRVRTRPTGLQHLPEHA
jgi:hypothetical protein